MRRTKLCLAAVMTLTAALANASEPGGVRVINRNTQGSAVIVGYRDNAAYLLSCDHVSRNASDVDIECYPGTYVAEILKRSPQDDLALFRIPNAPYPKKIYKISSKSSYFGKARILGCPQGVDPSWFAADLMASGIYRSADSRPGSSGGGVIANTTRELVGVNITTGSCVPLKQIHAFLRDYPFLVGGKAGGDEDIADARPTPRPQPQPRRPSPIHEDDESQRRKRTQPPFLDWDEDDDDCPICQPVSPYGPPPGFPFGPSPGSRGGGMPGMPSLPPWIEGRPGGRSPGGSLIIRNGNIRIILIDD